jgi:hypothetical protein
MPERAGWPALMPLPAEPYQYADTIAAVADIS